MTRDARASGEAGLCGRLQLTIGDETRVVESGAIFIIPPHVLHRAVAIDGPATVLEVFSPIREDDTELTIRYMQNPPRGELRG